MPRHGPSGPTHPTIKKRVTHFEIKGTRPSITIDLLPHHCQTIGSPFTRNQCNTTTREPSNNQQILLLTLIFFFLIANYHTSSLFIIIGYFPHGQAPSSLSQKQNTLSRQPLKTKSRARPTSTLGRQTPMVVTTHRAGNH